MLGIESSILDCLIQVHKLYCNAFYRVPHFIELFLVYFFIYNIVFQNIFA